MAEPPVWGPSQLEKVYDTLVKMAREQWYKKHVLNTWVSMEDERWDECKCGHCRMDHTGHNGGCACDVTLRTGVHGCDYTKARCECASFRRRYAEEGSGRPVGQ